MRSNKKFINICFDEKIVTHEQQTGASLQASFYDYNFMLTSYCSDIARQEINCRNLLENLRKFIAHMSLA